MEPSHKGLKAIELSPLVRRTVEWAPGYFVEERQKGQCFFCRPDGSGATWPVLFAVVVDGGLLLRLPEKIRESVVGRGIGTPSNALPAWVLEPSHDEQTMGGKFEEGAARNPTPHARIHGDPNEWVWIPVEDGEAFERRRPHILETMEYCKYLIEQRGKQSGGRGKGSGQTGTGKED